MSSHWLSAEWIQLVNLWNRWPNMPSKKVTAPKVKRKKITKNSKRLITKNTLLRRSIPSLSSQNSAWMISIYTWSKMRENETANFKMMGGRKHINMRRFRWSWSIRSSLIRSQRPRKTSKRWKKPRGRETSRVSSKKISWFPKWANKSKSQPFKLSRFWKLWSGRHLRGISKIVKKSSRKTLLRHFWIHTWYSFWCKPKRIRIRKILKDYSTKTTTTVKLILRWYLLSR